MSTMIGQRQVTNRLVANGASPDAQIVYVTRPEPIRPIARRLHDVLSDPTVPEIDRVRLEQLVSLALAMARGNSQGENA